MVGLMTIGILFKETMKGPFAFGSTEEADGARKCACYLVNEITGTHLRFIG